MTEETIPKGYVLTNRGTVLVQLPADNRWGFLLADDDQTWEGGLGAATSWDLIAADDPRISAADHERLDWLLEDWGFVERGVWLPAETEGS